MTKEDVIEKVRKLLRLSESSNENEATLAAAKAKELLTRYNLNNIDIDEDSGKVNFVREFSIEINELNEWINHLSKAVARLYNCDIFVALKREPKSGQTAVKDATMLVFIGEETNAKVATYVMAYLVTAIERLSEEAYEEKDVEFLWKNLPGNGTWVDMSFVLDRLASQQGKHNHELWLKSYRIGMTMRIAEKIISQIKVNEREQALIPYMQDAIMEHVKNKWGKAKEYNLDREDTRNFNQWAADRGYRDGERVEPRPAIERGT